MAIEEKIRGFMHGVLEHSMILSDAIQKDLSFKEETDFEKGYLASMNKFGILFPFTLTITTYVSLYNNNSGLLKYALLTQLGSNSLSFLKQSPRYFKKLI